MKYICIWGSWYSVQTKKGKILTKGAKQIKEENVSTLSFYIYMALGAIGIHFAVTMILFEFTTLTIVSRISCLMDTDVMLWLQNPICITLSLQSLTAFSIIVYVGSYQFMSYMAHATYSESGQLLDPGVDLNMEGGIAEWVFTATSHRCYFLLFNDKNHHCFTDTSKI